MKRASINHKYLDMTDLQRAKNIIDEEYYTHNSISQGQYEIVMGVLSSISPEHPVALNKLAESLWEGYDGCTESDKQMWINGFCSGYNYKKSKK